MSEGHNFPNLTVIDHPLVRHKMSVLRSSKTSLRDFRALVRELSTLMAYEATKDMEVEERTVVTPLEEFTGHELAGKEPALVPILRAGLGMVDGMADLLPQARIGHIGLARDEDSLQPIDYYFKTPDEAERLFLILDPMLATGGSMARAVTKLKKAGATKIKAVCLVAAPEGVRKMEQEHPDVQIFAAALDRGLNDRGYILPGLGDAGDRLYGTS